MHKNYAMHIVAMWLQSQLWMAGLRLTEGGNATREQLLVMPT